MLRRFALALCLLNSRHAFAAQCNATQERSDYIPTGVDVKAALTNDPTFSSICNERLLSGEIKTGSWNHGGIVISFTRTSTSATAFRCNEALMEIIDQCITPGQYYGGSWASTSESYSIYNQAFPANPLLPHNRDGSLPSGHASSSAISPLTFARRFTNTTTTPQSFSTPSQSSYSSTPSPISSFPSPSSSPASSISSPPSSFSSIPLSSSSSPQATSSIPISQSSASPSQSTTSPTNGLSTPPGSVSATVSPPLTSISLSGSPGQSSVSQSSTSDGTVLTEVISGSTITASFEPTSISQYSDLSSTLTTTTTSNGTPIPFVIFPGGWAWAWLGFGAGGGGAIGVIPTPPPVPPPGSGGGDDNGDPTSKTTPTASTTPSLSSSSSSSACPIGTISPGFPWQFGDDGPVAPTNFGSSTSSTPASSPSSSAISSILSTGQVASTTSSMPPSSTLSSTPTGTSSQTPSPSTTSPTTTTTTTTQQAPSCSTVTASGAVCTLCSDSTDPQCSAIGPPAPTQTSSNNKGSSLCGHAVTGDDCKAAYARYDENRVYTAYTSYTYTNGLDPINVLLPANDGCTAIFTCNSDAEYAVGMAGWAIIKAFDNLFANDKVKVCGSSYLSNGCHVTVNACSNCKDVNT